MIKAAQRLGYSVGDKGSDYQALLLELVALALEPLCQDVVYDFGATDMPARMTELAERVTDYRDFWQAPPSDAVFFHRKLGGMFMLASRIGARVNVQQLIRPWITD